MRIALCFSGMLRTWQVCVPTIIQHVIKANPTHQFDSFLATWDVRGRNPVWWEVTKDLDKVDFSKFHFPDLNLRSILVDIYYQSSLMEMAQRETQPGGRFVARGGPQCNPLNVIPMLKKIEQSYNLYMESCRTGIVYDLIIKLRTDLKFSGDLVVPVLDNHTICMPDHECWGPGINDQLMIGTPTTMGVHAALFNNLQSVFNEVGGTLHPETILHAWLQRYGIQLIKQTIPYIIER